MGLTKKQVFSKRQNQVAEYAKALAHPARVAIVQHLIRNRSCICGDLVTALPLSQSTISQHLKELKRIGLIKGEVEGPKVCYCIDGQVWESARKALNEVFGGFDGCCD